MYDVCVGVCSKSVQHGGGVGWRVGSGGRLQAGWSKAKREKKEIKKKEKMKK